MNFFSKNNTDWYFTTTDCDYTEQTTLTTTRRKNQRYSSSQNKEESAVTRKVFREEFNSIVGNNLFPHRHVTVRTNLIFFFRVCRDLKERYLLNSTKIRRI